MGIDASIPLGAGKGVQPFNFLDSAQRVNNLVQSTQQIQKNNALLAAGRDFQGAIGPNGQLNTANLNTALAGDPRAAYAAVDTSQAG